MQDLFRLEPGVISTKVGYAGGQSSNPTYEFHPGHAEAVEIAYNPRLTSYKTLLDFFFRIHDPTTKDRQGNDVGSSYRSVIFYENQKQLTVAKELIAAVNESGLYDAEVVTKLEKLTKFYSAEQYHQNYLQKNPGGYTCHYIRTTIPILSNYKI